MKSMKKFFALTLALVLLLGMAVSASADTGNSIKINGTAAGHQYEAYQIFVGDLSTNGTEKVLANVTWGDGISADGKTALGDAAAKAETIKTAENAKDFAKALETYLTNPKSFTAAGKAYTLSNLAAGYYLVKDAEESQEGEDGTYTAFIMQVVGAVEVNAKDSVPVVDKSVVAQDDNAADASIGDEITFILKATLGNNMEEYDAYKVVFHDTMSDGLSFVRYESATLDDKNVREKFVMEQSGQKLTFTCKDIIAEGADDGDVIIITYVAKLNSQAKVGPDGNDNTVKLEYSNNPNVAYDPTAPEDPDNPPPTGETPPDMVKVFTYQLDVIKVDAKNEETKLPGAQFVLLNEKQDKVALIENGKMTGWDNLPAEDQPWNAKSVLTTDNNGKFSIQGLGSDTYYLKEIKAPAGYNLLKNPVKVVITGTLNKNEDAAAQTLVTIKVKDGDPVNGTNGVVTATVGNNAGVVLPGTGGMGTTMFYIIGGLLAVAAVVLLVTKKRMASAE